MSDLRHWNIVKVKLPVYAMASSAKWLHLVCLMFQTDAQSKYIFYWMFSIMPFKISNKTKICAHAFYLNLVLTVPWKLNRIPYHLRLEWHNLQNYNFWNKRGNHYHQKQTSIFFFKVRNVKYIILLLYAARLSINGYLL